jgi:hypothetical protein
VVEGRENEDGGKYPVDKAHVIDAAQTVDHPYRDGSIAELLG